MRKRGVSLTTLTANYMRSLGFVGDTTERRTGPITRDFLGFADSVWILSDPLLSPHVLSSGGSLPRLRALAVQHTGGAIGKSGGNLAARVKKVQANPRARAWLEEGGEIWVIAWQRKDGRVWPERVAVELPGRE